MNFTAMRINGFLRGKGLYRIKTGPGYSRHAVTERQVMSAVQHRVNEVR